MGKRIYSSSCVDAVEAYSCNFLQSAKFVAFGSNANTNGLLRRYILKGTDLSMRSHAYVGVSTMESGRFDDASSLSGVREMIAVIFELWPAPEKMQTYLDMGARLGPQLEKMDGFISIEQFPELLGPGQIAGASYLAR